MPTVRGTGAVSSGVSSATPGLPATNQVGDFLILFVESNSGDTITPSAGWNTGPQVATTNDSNGTQLSVFYKVSVGGDATTVTCSSGDHILARIVGIQGATCDTSGFAFTQTSTENVADTSGSATAGMTTTFDYGFVITAAAVGGDPGADLTTAFSGWTNAGLSGIVERVDNGVAVGSGGHLGVATGEKASAGAIAATTFTCPSAYKAMVTLVLQQPVELGNFPAAAASATATQISTAASSWSVTLPGSVASGDLLVMCVRAGGNQTCNTPGGWTAMVDNMIDDGTDDTTSLYYKVSSGGESGSVSLSFSAAAKGVAFVYRITGDKASGPVYSVGGWGAISAYANADSRDCNMAAIRNHLWLSFVFLDGTTQTFTAPTGFSGLVQGNSGSGGVVASNVRGATCWRQEQNWHLTPGNYTNAAPSSGHTTLVIGVIPQPPAITQVSGTDSGSGSDTASVTAVQITLTDTGTGAEAETFIDNFNRADDTTPPPGASWSNWKLPGWNLVSNQLAPSANTADVYLLPNMPADVDAMIEFTAIPSGNEAWIGILARLEPGAVDGYMVQQYVNYLSNPANDYVNIHRYDDWNPVMIGGSYNVHLDPADALRIVCAGSSIQAWARISGNWQLCGSVTDATYDGTGLNRKVALIHYGGDGAGSLNTRLDNFASGPVIPTVAIRDSVSDTGASTDASVLAVSFSLTDTGVGSDVSVLDKHATPVSGSDTGSSSDASVIAAAITGSDVNGTTTENGSAVIAPIVVGDDAGVGSEIISNINKTMTDFGGATESAVTATLAGDTGISLDEIASYIRGLLDTGVGAEGYAIRKEANDAGAGTENGIIAALISSIEAILGYELILPAAARYTQTETSSGTEGVTNDVRITVSDSGTLADTGTRNSAFTAIDTGSGTETSVFTYAVTVSETGTGSEASTLAVRSTFTDTGLFTETSLIPMSLTDSAIGSDASFVNRILTDSGSFTEAYALRMQVDDLVSSADAISSFIRVLADSGALIDDSFVITGDARIGAESAEGVDTGSMKFLVTVSDSGVFNEIGAFQNPVTGNETGVFSESIVIRILLSEIASGADITSLGRAFAEIAIGADQQLVQAGNAYQVADNGTVVENSILEKKLTLPESGIFTENLSLIVAYSIQDSGSVSENTSTAVAPIRIDDNGQGSDQGAIRKWVVVSDSGIFTERGHAGLFVITKFSESILVSANGEESKLVAGNHPYYVGV